MVSTKVILSGIAILALSWSVQADPSEPCEIGKLDVAIQSDDVWEDCGGQLVLNSVQEEPAFLRFEEANDASKYILVMVDPDSPNSTMPIYKYWLHWLLKDIPGSNFKSGTFGGDSEEVHHEYTEAISYLPPSPPVGSGSHRYQFFVYEQSSNDLGGLPAEARSGFDLDDFAESNSLGNPVAAFEFTSENSGGEL